MWRLLPVLALTIFGNTLLASGQATKPPAAGDHAIIQKRRMVLTRDPEVIVAFPQKKIATVTYPVISGLRPPVLTRVRTILEFKNIFDYSLKEYRQDSWLDEFTYEVNHNGNYLLDLTFNQSGSGAYPDDQSKHFLINLRDGTVVKAADAFQEKQLPELATKVNEKLKAELQRILKSLRESKSDPEDVRVASEAQEPLEFKIENLNDFSVNAKGVTFLYDAGYPHAIRAFQPVGKYFFTYAELKPFIKLDGPLGQFVH
jgi:hypothetical protein